MEEKIETQKFYQVKTGLRWSSIFGGWLFAYAFAMLLYLLGAAAGITTIATLNEINRGITIGAGIWIVFSWVLSTFIGGIFAGRSAGSSDRSSGIIHGLLVWALSGIMTLFIGSVQAAAVAQTGLRATQGIMQAAQQTGVVSGQIPDQIQNAFREQFKEQAGKIVAQNAAERGVTVDPQKIQTAVEQLDQPTLTQLTAELIRGNTQGAKDILSQKTDLTQSEINHVTMSFVGLVPEYSQQIRNQAEDVADKAGTVTSVGLWALFFASLLGLLAGAWGGAIGARLAANAYALQGTFYKSSFSNFEEEAEAHKKTA